MNSLSLRWFRQHARKNQMLKLVQHDLLIVIMILTCLCSCKTKSQRERNYKKPYHREDNELKAQLFLYHGLNNTSFVYYKINTTQLLYKKIDTNTYFSSRIKVSYKFRPDAAA